MSEFADSANGSIHRELGLREQLPQMRPIQILPMFTAATNPARATAYFPVPVLKVQGDATEETRRKSSYPID